MKYLLILLTLFSLTANAQTSGKTLGGNYPSGFYGFRNYMLNPGGEIDAQNVSVAGTGGTIGVFSNNPITNKKSFRVGGNLNTNITGTFTAAPFDQGLGDSNNNCAAGFNLQPNGTGTYTMNIKVGSTTVATRSFTTTSGVPVQYQTFLFSCGAYGLTPTIDIIANLTSGSGTDHYQADDFYMGQDPGFIGSMAIRTQEAAYTATITNLGTVITQSLKWYQDGSNVFIHGNVTCAATVGGSTVTISLPSGYTSAANISTPENAGTWVRDASSADKGGLVLISPSATVFNLGAVGTFGSTSSVGLANAIGTSVCSAGNVISINAKIPIAGASNIQATTSQCLQDGSCLNNFSAKVSSAAVVSDENIAAYISGTSLSTATFTITFGITFGVAPNCGATLNGGSNGTVRVDSVSTTQVVVSTFDSSFAPLARGFVLKCDRAGTDAKPVMQAPWVNGSVTSNAANPERVERARITCGNSGSAVVSSSSSWLTVVNGVAAGRCTVNISTQWSTEPTCTLTIAGLASPPTTATWAVPYNLSASTFNVNRMLNGSDTTGDVYLICEGPR